MKYKVIFESFAEAHFIKSFVKKHKGAWDKTLKALSIEFAFVELLFEKTIAETISLSEDGKLKLCKTEFKIAGSDVSRRTSGNRCIIVVDSIRSSVYVLLVYNKNDLKGNGNETSKWKELVKINYPEYIQLLG